MPTLRAFGAVDEVELTHKPADPGCVEVRFRSGATLQVEPQHLGGVHRLGDMDTAVMAGRAHATTGGLGDLHFKVLTALAAAGARGMTDDEHENVNQIRADSAGKRRLEMERLGYVRKADGRRQTRRGAMAAVWRITEAGEEALAHARAQIVPA